MNSIEDGIIIDLNPLLKEAVKNSKMEQCSKLEQPHMRARRLTDRLSINLIKDLSVINELVEIFKKNRTTKFYFKIAFSALMFLEEFRDHKIYSSSFFIFMAKELFKDENFDDNLIEFLASGNQCQKRGAKNICRYLEISFENNISDKISYAFKEFAKKIVDFDESRLLDLDAPSLEELRQICSIVGVKSDGKRSELVLRIEEFREKKAAIEEIIFKDLGGI